MRPKTLCGAVVALLALAGCVQPPDITGTDSDVQIGEPIQIVVLQCQTPDGWPFLYEGPADTAPWAYCEAAA